MKNELKTEKYAVILILFSFCVGMVLTAATSGCDVSQKSAAVAQPIVVVE